MDTLRAIRERTSVREYRQDAVPDSVIRELMEAAAQAPSSGNVQDWEFIVVKNPGTKKAIAEVAMDQGFIGSAPAVIVVCSDLRKVSSAYGQRGASLYSVQNTSAAIENLLLAAWDKGLGCCWVGAFSEQALKELLALPTNIRPLAIITLGYPLSIPKKRARRKPGIHWEHW